MRQNRGFTLIELMIVVAIIAVLAGIAIPNYSEYVTRSKVMEAVSGLSDMRVRMEQFFQDNRTYVGTAVANGCPIEVPVPKNFVFACNAVAVPTAITYTLTATGQNTMNGFVYTVNQLNQRSTTMTAPSTWPGSTSCWVLSKGGTC